MVPYVAVQGMMQGGRVGKRGSGLAKSPSDVLFPTGMHRKASHRFTGRAAERHGPRQSVVPNNRGQRVTWLNCRKGKYSLEPRLALAFTLLNAERIVSRLSLPHTVLCPPHLPAFLARSIFARNTHPLGPAIALSHTKRTAQRPCGVPPSLPSPSSR